MPKIISDLTCAIIKPDKIVKSDGKIFGKRKLFIFYFLFPYSQNDFVLYLSVKMLVNNAVNKDHCFLVWYLVYKEILSNKTNSPH